MDDQVNVGHYKYIIIGGGIAGVTCAEHLYILNSDASILLITATSLVKAIKNVIQLTKTLDSFNVKEEYHSELEAQYPGLKVVKDVVINLNSRKQVVHCQSGALFSYDRLCICTGASPKNIFPKNPYVLWLRDTESVVQFKKRVENAKRIVIVGNGGIATELVFQITGIEIIWAIKDDYLNAAFLDPAAAEFLKEDLTKDKTTGISSIVKRMQFTVENESKEQLLMGAALGPDWKSAIDIGKNAKRSVNLVKNVEIKEIYNYQHLRDAKNSCNEEGWPAYVELTDGQIFGCDFIISATGVSPNISMVEGSNCKRGSDGGLLINSKMQTSLENVYAAGDVCSPDWELAHHWFQMRLWTQARQMGSYAAKCMWTSFVGEEIYMDFCFELFSHATTFFGHKVILLGLFNGQKLGKNYEVILRITKGSEYIKCVMVDGKMQGAVLIGETDLEETFENLILNQMDLSSYGEDLLNPDIDIEDYFD